MMMTEEVDGFKFVCKLCNKRYPCGKSLGGHMSSHAIVSSADQCEEKFDKALAKIPYFASANVESSVDPHPNYCLREKLRKTWRAVDTVSRPTERICKQCGKGFQSMKALCGHMACHSEKDRGLKDDHSWTSENQKLLLQDSYSDTDEAEEPRLRTRSLLKIKKSQKIVSPSFSIANYYNGSSSVSDIDGQVQEEVAICLMLLSRDKSGVNSVLETSDNNSVVLETKSSSIDMKIGKTGRLSYIYNQTETGDVKLKGVIRNLGGDLNIARPENSDSGYFLDEYSKAESDVSVDYGEDYFSSQFAKNSNRTKNSYGTESGKRKYVSGNGEHNEMCNSSKKKSKYECFNCNKSFKSYQALGGHRPCNKKNPSHESGENSLDDDDDDPVDFRKGSKNNYADKKVNNKKNNKAHICPFCNREFRNGQALGGHKRSHFIGGHVGGGGGGGHANRVQHQSLIYSILIFLLLKRMKMIKMAIYSSGRFQ